MPAYFDESTKTWFVKFYYQDWQGNKKQKLKRGFPRKGEALSFERKFLEDCATDVNMTFESLYKLYWDDMSHRLRESTLGTKKHIIATKILPYFGSVPISQIKPTNIRKWQNDLLEHGYSQTYLKTINNQLTAILNYAVRFYDLKYNPSHKAGSIGKSKAEEMMFWTQEEFNLFISAVSNKAASQTIFKVLYWTGIREGELLALTKADVDLNNKVLIINKTYQRIGGKDVITLPKTPKSNRKVPIPDSLCSELDIYMQKLYKLKPKERIFPYTKHYLAHEMKRGSTISNVKKIRIHDLRHPYVKPATKKFTTFCLNTYRNENTGNRHSIVLYQSPVFCLLYRPVSPKKDATFQITSSRLPG